MYKTVFIIRHVYTHHTLVQLHAIALKASHRVNYLHLIFVKVICEVKFFVHSWDCLPDARFDCCHFLLVEDWCFHGQGVEVHVEFRDGDVVSWCGVRHVEFLVKSPEQDGVRVRVVAREVVEEKDPVGRAGTSEDDRKIDKV